MQIVYYSLFGTNEKIARQLAGMLDLPLYRIEDVAARKGLFGFIRSGYESTHRKCPQIRPIDDYQPDPEHVVLLSPIWAGRISSPMRTFLTQYSGKFSTFSLILTRTDLKNRYEEMIAEVSTITGAKCQVFESFFMKTVNQDDIQSLYERLVQTDGV